MSKPTDAPIPPGLYSDRPDRGLTIVAKALPGLLRLAGRTMPAKRPVELEWTRRLVVRQRTGETADGEAVSFLLAAADGSELPEWRPGAHLDVLLPSGLQRHYSLNGDPTDPHHYRIAVRRLARGGGGSVELHDTVAVGDHIAVRGPRNAFPFVAPGYGSPATDIRFVAGGIGITPILPMLRVAEAAGVDWSLVYVGRSRASLPFLDELAQYGDRVTVRTDDVHGLPTADVLLDGVHAGSAVYHCGPAAMLDEVNARIVQMPGTELHFERFAAAPVRDGRAFDVRLARTGETVRVPANASLLAAVLPGRSYIGYSCQQGFCGTCKVRVLAGEVDHRDTLLTDDERADGQMLICISRAAGQELVIDV